MVIKFQFKRKGNIDVPDPIDSDPSRFYAGRVEEPTGCEHRRRQKAILWNASR